MLERIAGIEPAHPVWKAGVLPLNYIRMYRRDEGARRAGKKGGKQHVRLLTWASMLLFYIDRFGIFGKD